MYSKNYEADYSYDFPANDELAGHFPYVTHITEESILCKDGIIVQTIELDSVKGLAVDKYEDIISLRREVRSAILDIFNDPMFSIYIHTVRRRRNIASKDSVPFGFAEALNDKWVEKNNWSNQLCNTIYLTIAIQSPSYSTFNFKGFLNSIFPSLLRKQAAADIIKLNKYLTEKTDKLLTRLSRFGAKKLSLRRAADGYVSENLGFFHHISHLAATNCYAPVRDYSKYLSHFSLMFKFNTIEVKNYVSNQEKKYSAIFNIKQNVDTDLDVIDPLLHMGTEFIITQVVLFAANSDAKQHYDYLKRVSSFYKEDNISNKIGIEEFYKSDDGYANDYAKILTLVNIFSDNQELFDYKVKKFLSITDKLGLVTTREDFNMPRYFWAQLPGNLRYLDRSRMLFLNTSRIGQYISLINNQSGNFQGSPWGKPVTIIRSVKGTPFYFNFHNKESNPNTLIIGPKGAGKKVLMRFFLAQTLKFSPKIINLDFNGTSKKFFDILGGKSIEVDIKTRSPLQLNPFKLSNYHEGKIEFRTWLHRAIYPSTIELPQFIEFFNELSSHLLSADENISKVAILQEAIKDSHDEMLKTNFNKYFNEQIFSSIFTEKDDAHALETLLSETIINIDLSEIAKDPGLIEAYLGLLLKTIKNSLDGKPAIIVIQDISYVMDTNHFAPHFFDWLNFIRQNNAMALCCHSRADKTDSNNNFKKALGGFGTKIITSDKYADKYFRILYGLDERELNSIKSFEKSRRIFLLKQDELSIPLQLDFSGLGDILEVLSQTDQG